MKKKYLILALAASTLFLSTLTSCDSNNTNPVLTETNNYLDDYNYKKVFDELKKSFNAITYEDFILNVEINESENVIKFTYNNSYVTISNTGYFVDKQICFNDEDGNILSKRYSKYVSDKWVTLEESKFINAKEVTVYSIYLNQDGLFENRHEYTYDYNGNKVSETYSKYINNEWVKTKEYIYINNEKKIVYEITFIVDDSLVLSFDAKSKYTYDEAGNLLTYAYSKYVNNKWVNVSKNEYTYDSNGNKIQYINSNLIDDLWRQDKYLNTYDEKGNKLSTTYFLICNNVLGYVAKYEYSYDDNNKLSKETAMIWIDNHWVNDYKDEYTYDEKGNMLSETRSRFDGSSWTQSWAGTSLENGAWKYVTRYDYTYDEEGNKTSTLKYVYSDGEWVLEN